MLVDSGDVMETIRMVWSQVVKTNDQYLKKLDVSYLWSEADLEHRISEGIARSPNMKDVQTHSRGTLDGELYGSPLKKNIERFWRDYRKKYPRARAYPDLAVHKAWNVDDPFLLCGELKFYQSSNYFDIGSLTKDLNRLSLLRQDHVCREAVMMVANYGLGQSDGLAVTSALDRYERRKLPVLRRGC
jgi:hypothetical protein